MQGTSPSSGGPSTPRLRLLSHEDRALGSRFGEVDGHAPHAPADARPALRVVGQELPLLIAGTDAARRAALLDELTQSMPGEATFTEAGSLSEVLEHAPVSRIVIFSGGLEDISRRSLMRMLGQRHPRLPVVSLDASEGEDL
jgi:hypothetical protein